MIIPLCTDQRQLFTDSDFAINCGGDTLRTSDTNYERDNETLGVASYYVTSANNWAVSSVGRYLEGTNDAYTRFTQQTFSNALNLQLFQSIRLSPVSLRYYGLGLENGNYTVNLQFADIDFPDSATWQSVGRRVFDIYIQVCALNYDMLPKIVRYSCSFLLGYP